MALGSWWSVRGDSGFHLDMFVIRLCSHSHLVLSVGELLVLIQWIMSVVHGVTSMSGPTSVHSYATKDDHILDIMPNVVA